MSIQRFHVGKRLSEMVIHDNTIYLAGQVADDAKTDAASQVRQVLAQIDKLLAEAGSDKTKILSATIYLPSMADFPALNAGLGSLGAGGSLSGPRHGRSETRRPRLQSRDPDHCRQVR